MDTRQARLTPLDRLYLQRAYELAARGIGSTSPNPPVGAVFVRDGQIVGEGYHHRAGEAHAEANALAQAGEAARGATLYVSLEPCNHVGRMSACSPALADAGIARAVVGTIDPYHKANGRGVAFLRERGINVEVVNDPQARDLIEIFGRVVAGDRPYLALKMASSLDGCITGEPGIRQQLTGSMWAQAVRELRIAHDAVMVGVGTVRVDDPLLTVRPPHHRLRPFVRIVVCETDTVPVSRRIFGAVPDYAKTIVLAPAGARERFDNLRKTGDVILVGDAGDRQLDLVRAMRALREHGVYSVLCEGGPTLAGRLIAAGVVDRFYWAIAPVLLRNDRAVPVLAGVDLAALRMRLHFDRIVHVGEDVVLSGTLANV